MKNLKKLGKVLSTKEQKNVNGGYIRLICAKGILTPSCGCCESIMHCDIDSNGLSYCGNNF
jgi:hypothetical protein